jgi:hypothetical protein
MAEVGTSDLIGARYQPQGVNLWLSPDYQRLLTTDQALAELAAELKPAREETIEE